MPDSLVVCSILILVLAIVCATRNFFIFRKYRSVAENKEHKITISVLFCILAALIVWISLYATCDSEIKSVREWEITGIEFEKGKTRQVIYDSRGDVLLDVSSYFGYYVDPNLFCVLRIEYKVYYYGIMSTSLEPYRLIRKPL